MIDAAIVGLGRWGRTLVEAVQGKSAALRFTRAVSRDPARHRDFAAAHGLAFAADFAAVLADPTIAAVVPAHLARLEARLEPGWAATTSMVPATSFVVVARAAGKTTVHVRSSDGDRDLTVTVVAPPTIAAPVGSFPGSSPPVAAAPR